MEILQPIYGAFESCDKYIFEDSIVSVIALAVFTGGAIGFYSTYSGRWNLKASILPAMFFGATLLENAATVQNIALLSLGYSISVGAGYHLGRRAFVSWATTSDLSETETQECLSALPLLALERLIDKSDDFSVLLTAIQSNCWISSAEKKNLLIRTLKKVMTFDDAHKLLTNSKKCVTSEEWIEIVEGILSEGNKPVKLFTLLALLDGYSLDELQKMFPTRFQDKEKLLSTIKQSADGLNLEDSDWRNVFDIANRQTWCRDFLLTLIVSQRSTSDKANKIVTRAVKEGSDLEGSQYKKLVQAALSNTNDSTRGDIFEYLINKVDEDFFVGVYAPYLLICLIQKRGEQVLLKTKTDGVPGFNQTITNYYASELTVSILLHTAIRKQWAKLVQLFVERSPGSVMFDEVTYWATSGEGSDLGEKICEMATRTRRLNPAPASTHGIDSGSSWIQRYEFGVTKHTEKPSNRSVSPLEIARSIAIDETSTDARLKKEKISLLLYLHEDRPYQAVPEFERIKEHYHNSFNNHFERLGIGMSRSATEAALAREIAYVEKLKLLEIVNAEYAGDRKEKLRRAYRVLSDPDTKAKYLIALEREEAFLNAKMFLLYAYDLQTPLTVQGIEKAFDRAFEVHNPDAGGSERVYERLCQEKTMLLGRVSSDLSIDEAREILGFDKEAPLTKALIKKQFVQLSLAGHADKTGEAESATSDYNADLLKQARDKLYKSIGVS